MLLALAPAARPVISPVAAAVTLPDFTDSRLTVMGDGECLHLGRKTLRIILAPWVHAWDSLIVDDETDRVLNR